MFWPITEAESYVGERDESTRTKPFNHQGHEVTRWSSLRISFVNLRALRGYVSCLVESGANLNQDFFSHILGNYFPMQNVLKIKFRMSSVVVAPVIASSGRKALYRSSNDISCGTLLFTALRAASSAASDSCTSP